MPPQADVVSEHPNPLRAGVAGAGVFGGFHARKYAEALAADFIGVFDPAAEAAEKAASAHGARAFSDFDALLAEIDVVTIAAPASFHYELARAALNAGKHVLVEKPIALNLSDADDLIALAEANGLTLQVGHQERFVAEAFGLLALPEAPRHLKARAAYT